MQFRPILPSFWLFSFEICRKCDYISRCPISINSVSQINIAIKGRCCIFSMKSANFSREGTVCTVRNLAPFIRNYSRKPDEEHKSSSPWWIAHFLQQTRSGEVSDARRLFFRTGPDKILSIFQQRFAHIPLPAAKTPGAVAPQSPPPRCDLRRGHGCALKWRGFTSE